MPKLVTVTVTSIKRKINCTIITLFDIDLEKEEVFVFDFKTNGKTFEEFKRSNWSGQTARVL